MQGIATAEEFFSSPRPQRFQPTVPQSAAARAYGGTQVGTTPLQKVTVDIHRQAANRFEQTLHLHAAGRHLEAEHERSRAVALVSLLHRTVLVGSGSTADELYRIYDYLLGRLDGEALDSTEATGVAYETMRTLAEAWEYKYRQGNMLSFIAQRANRVGPF